MNKTEFVAGIAAKSGLSKKDAEKAWDAAAATIVETLAGGDKLSLVGFGTFETRKRAARTGRNPQKPGETIQIAAATVPAFKAGKGFKDAVNK